jgi:hypothetical protein
MTANLKTAKPYRLVHPDTGAVIRECKTLREALGRRTVHEVAGMSRRLAVEAVDRNGRWVTLGVGEGR